MLGSELGKFDGLDVGTPIGEFEGAVDDITVGLLEG